MELLDGLHLLQQGEWQLAHEIAAGYQTRLGFWLHGVVHLARRDEVHARCWYVEAGRPFPGLDALDAEMAALQLALALNV